jgi:hypothetical protein
MKKMLLIMLLATSSICFAEEPFDRDVAMAYYQAISSDIGEPLFYSSNFVQWVTETGEFYLIMSKTNDGLYKFGYLERGSGK